jgi:hypothetical protein
VLAVIKINDFTRDNIRDYRVTNPVRGIIDEKEVANRPPEIRMIEKTSGMPVPEVKIHHLTVKLRETEIKKMNLSPQETKRLEQNSSRVKNEVLIPPEDFHKSRVKEHRNQKKIPIKSNCILAVGL